MILEDISVILFRGSKIQCPGILGFRLSPSAEGQVVDPNEEEARLDAVRKSSGFHYSSLPRAQG